LYLAVPPSGADGQGRVQVLDHGGDLLDDVVEGDGAGDGGADLDHPGPWRCLSAQWRRGSVSWWGDSNPNLLFTRQERIVRGVLACACRSG
jgi:hypothetical protein